MKHLTILKTAMRLTASAALLLAVLVAVVFVVFYTIHMWG